MQELGFEAEEEFVNVCACKSEELKSQRVQLGGTGAPAGLLAPRSNLLYARTFYTSVTLMWRAAECGNDFADRTSCSCSLAALIELRSAISRCRHLASTAHANPGKRGPSSERAHTHSAPNWITGGGNML